MWIQFNLIVRIPSDKYLSTSSKDCITSLILPVTAKGILSFAWSSLAYNLINNPEVNLKKIHQGHKHVL